jgi:hypothetical protein
MIVACLVAIVLPALEPSAKAERPDAPRLMPDSTLGVVRIANTPLLVERFRETALGRIGQDSRMKPLVGQIYAAAQDTFKQIEDRVGLPLKELLAIPQGEVCVGFAAPPEEEPGFIVVLDTKDKVSQARKLLSAAEDFARRNGGARASEKWGQQDVVIYTGIGPVSIYSIEQDGTFIFATTKTLMQAVLANLEGTGLEKTLADNSKYNAIMSRCANANEEPPQLTWYVDPISLIRRLASGSFVATGLALFPVLGLDGLQGVGGTITFASGEFDEIQHLHVLLDLPRRGVIDAIGLRSGDSTPEPWVPSDCVSYSTINWDLRHTFNVSADLYNGLMGEGQLEREIRVRVSDNLGADFEKELMPLLTGRLTHVQWVEKPVRINSITTIVGVQLKDAEAFKPTLDKILQKHSDKVEKQLYGTVHYWSVKGAKQRQREGGTELRQPMPCIGIVGDYVIMTDSLKAFQEVVSAQSDPERSLSTSLDFKLIASKIKRQRGGDAPGAVQFSRPEEGLRFWYDLLNSDNTRKRLSEQGSKNRFFGSVNQALKDNPLPPFSVLAEYLAPGGGMLVNDETGIHYMTFTLKRQ